MELHRCATVEHCGTLWMSVLVLVNRILYTLELEYCKILYAEELALSACLCARLKFRTVTGTRGFFAKLFLSACLDINILNLVLIFALVFVFILVLISVSIFVFISRVETQNIAGDEHERCCFSGAFVTQPLFTRSAHHWETIRKPLPLVFLPKHTLTFLTFWTQFVWDPEHWAHYWETFFRIGCLLSLNPKT